MFKIKSYRKNYKVSFLSSIPEITEKLPNNHYIIIDSNVVSKYPFFKNDYVIESNEFNKTIDKVSELLEFLISNNIKKGDTLVAVGGGVIQDIVSFTANVLYRGIDWIFIPTTLLSQCDSCIGSKSSLNFKNYKNLLGYFYPPTKIFICKSFLKSLSKKDIKSGIGEMYHFFILSNHLKTAEKLNSMYDDILYKNINIDYFTKKSLKIKKKLIEKDEFDKGVRNVFNFGHTFGHAIEKITCFKINHGQAVSLGIIIASYISMKLNFIREKKFIKIFNIIFKNLPYINNIKIKEYIEVLSKDKKNTENNICCILLKRNKAIKHTMNKNDIQDLLMDFSCYLKEYNNENLFIN